MSNSDLAEVDRGLGNSDPFGVELGELRATVATVQRLPTERPRRSLVMDATSTAGTNWEVIHSSCRNLGLRVSSVHRCRGIRGVGIAERHRRSNSGCRKSRNNGCKHPTEQGCRIGCSCGASGRHSPGIGLGTANQDSQAEDAGAAGSDKMAETLPEPAQTPRSNVTSGPTAEIVERSDGTYGWVRGLEALAVKATVVLLAVLALANCSYRN